MYEKEISRLRRDLAHTTNQYVDALVRSEAIASDLEQAEDAECIVNLRHEMRRWDEKARGRHTPIHVPTLPEAQNASK